MTIKVIAFMAIKPDQEQAFLDAVDSAIKTSRNEPGIISYDLWREIGGEGRFIFNEQYRDRAAFDSHIASDHLREMGTLLPSMLSQPPAMIMAEAIDVAE